MKRENGAKTYKKRNNIKKEKEMPYLDTRDVMLKYNSMGADKVAKRNKSAVATPINTRPTGKVKTSGCSSLRG